MSDQVTQQIKEHYLKKNPRPDIRKESLFRDISQWVRNSTIDYTGNNATYNKNWRRTMMGAGATTVGYFISPVVSIPLFLYTITKAYQTHKDKQVGGRSIC